MGAKVVNDNVLRDQIAILEQDLTYLKKRHEHLSRRTKKRRAQILRAQFAGLAMQAIISKTPHMRDPRGENIGICREIAGGAVEYADALLKELGLV